VRDRREVSPAGRAAGRLAALAVLAAVTLAPATASGQVGGGNFQPGMGQSPGSPGTGLGTPSPTKSKPGVKAAPGMETHAASNAEAAQSLQTQEPTLPQNPLELSPDVKKRIGTSAEREVEVGRAPKVERDWYGLYYQEKSGSYRFRTLFPLWAERSMPGDRASLFGPYFNRRSKNSDADVLFPFFFRLREQETRTTIVGPFIHREREATPRAPARHDNWLAPLFFEGASANGSGYLHIPPLLTFTQHTARSGFNLVGPLFCSWKGGPSCDPRTADKIDLGIAPLYFYGRDETSEYELIPPLLHYYRYSDIGDRSFNLWGPVLSERSPEGNVFNVMPFYWHNWAKNEDHTTLFPFFHYGYKGAASKLITPLFYKSTGEHGESTFITWGYARYRGRTELDMWSPLFWQYRDPDIGLDRKVFFPFFYSSTSPRSEDTVVFPFYGHFKRPGLSETTWVTPLFRHTHDISGWETDIFPFFYAGRQNQSSHLVVAPLFWDFNSPHSRTTLALPIYYRFADDNSVTQVALNTYYHERKLARGKEWEFHFFPLFSYGESPTGHWWNVLYGLAGYTKDGTMAKMRALYVPITLSK
jgi:hypothetical protein